MAILIVDDESSTRTALRDLLTQLGHKTILEAKNGEEALKTLETEKGRIRLIVADWEMPYMDGIQLLHRVAQLPDLDLTPFLLITSDLPRARLAELQAKTDRLDAFLIKPFRMTALSQAMTAAQSHRASLRRKIVGLCANASLPDPLRAALAKPETAKLWDAPLLVGTLTELEQAVQVHASRLGAILIDPRLAPPVSAQLAEWLSSFGKTPLGTQTPVICLSRDPAAIFPLRTLCQAFVAQNEDADEAASEANWGIFWARLRKGAQSQLELELLFQELKSELQQKKTTEARKICEKILALDETSSDAHSTLGDLLEAQGKRDEALSHYWSALEINPCLPKPYIRLLECNRPGSAELAKSATLAAAHCPQNPDVLLAAARAWQAQGDPARAEELARRILAINPNHAGARSLLIPAS